MSKVRRVGARPRWAPRSGANSLGGLGERSVPRRRDTLEKRYGWDLAAADYESLWQAQLAPQRVSRTQLDDLMVWVTIGIIVYMNVIAPPTAVGMEPLHERFAMLLASGAASL